MACNKPVPLADLQHTVDLYMCGHSIRKVASLMDLSYTAVRHRLVNLARVELRGRGGNYGQE